MGGRRYGILADEETNEDKTIGTLNALDLVSETHKILAKEKECMTTRADVLRTLWNPLPLVQENSTIATHTPLPTTSLGPYFTTGISSSTLETL